MKRFFGIIEAAFNVSYLLTVIIIGTALFFQEGDYSTSFGVMSLVLGVGDAFHLVPRIMIIIKKDENDYTKSLGIGKMITSITMTVFYFMLWETGKRIGNIKSPVYVDYLMLVLTSGRVLLTAMPQNKWLCDNPPVKWGIIRNIPFVLQGLLVAGLYLAGGRNNLLLNYIGIAIVFSFMFYIPVVLWAKRNPKVGMLMLPKTCAYVSILVIALCLK